MIKPATAFCISLSCITVVYLSQGKVIAQTLDQQVNQCMNLMYSGSMSPDQLRYCQQVFGVAKCVNAQQERSDAALARLYNAKVQEGFCETDACRDIWRTRESDAQQEFDEASSTNAIFACHQ